MNAFLKHKIVLIPLFFFVFLGGSCVSNSSVVAASIPKPSIYDMDHLEFLRKKGLDDPVIARFVRRVRKIAKEAHLTVVGKEHSYSSNPHDYCSIAGYSWADENKPDGPYVTKDGVINPEREKYDRPKLNELANRCKFLSVAYYITEDTLFYEAIEKNLRAWFLDSVSYMTPNFEYAQVVRGKNDNKGQAYGLVDMVQFTPILESILLVNSVTEIDNILIGDLQKWFADFLSWVLDSHQWQQVKLSNNNIASGCYVAIAEMARFTGNTTINRRVYREYTRRIINTQILSDGRQPAELKRTIGFGYSVGNLRHIVDFALIMENSGKKYYKRNQRRIDAAFEYLFQFVDNHESFPYQQIKPWEHYEELLKENAMRLQRLSSRKSVVSEYSKNIMTNYSNDILDYVY